MFIPDRTLIPVLREQFLLLKLLNMIPFANGTNAPLLKWDFSDHSRNTHEYIISHRKIGLNSTRTFNFRAIWITNISEVFRKKNIFSAELNDQIGM